MGIREINGEGRFLTRRGFLGALAALGAGGLLAGCGGGEGSSPSPSGPAQPDLARFTPNYAGSVTRNHWPALPVRVHFTNDITLTPPGGAATRANDLIRAAFDRWPAATGGTVGYTLTDDPALANISVTTTTIPDPHGLSETGTTSVSAPSGNVLTSAVMQIFVWPDITVLELTQGLLHQGDEDAYFVCTVTAKGREAWQERRPVAATLPRDPSRWREADAGSDDVLTTLKQWRTARASREAVPPYCVFSDKTLMEIARARPGDEGALLEVSGVGPGKLEKYGGDVLRITGAA